MKKVVFCISNIYGIGGMERVLLDRIKELEEKKKYKIYIVITENIKDNYFEYKFLKSIEIKNLEINYYNLKKVSIIKRIIMTKIKGLKHKKKLKLYLEEIQPDVVVALGTEEKYILPKVKGKYRIILEHHFEKNYLKRKKGGVFYKLLVKYLESKEKKLLEEFDEFLVLTNEDKEQWKSSKIKVIPNYCTIDTKRVSDLKNKKVIAVGRLEYQKGFDILIDVWKKVNEICNDWILEIYGEGNERKKLENKIREYGLEDKIFLKGIEKNIGNKYLESSIYIMTSRFEGMPMVLLEAQSYGLPLVSFDCPCGPKDMIENGKNGYIVKFADVEGMVSKILKLIQNESLRKKFGNNSLKSVKKYSKEVIIQKWEELLNE